MSRIGSNTNSNDPMMIKSRVFVGNIDSRLSREELEIIFGKYGSISALSLHKGYGFVQYTDELSARAAVFGENNKQYYSKLLDCNVASEPKSNRKRLPQQQQAVSSQPNTWQSQSYSSVNNPYLAATAHALAVQAQSAAAAAVAAANSANSGGSASKRARLQNSLDHSSGARKTSNLVSLVSATPSQPPPPTRPPMVPQAKNVKDILICGNCKELFDSYEGLISHKALGCRLRFICRCKQMGEPRSLTCIQCGVCSQSSWELIQHHVTEHGGSFFVGEERFFTAATSVDSTGDNEKEDDATCKKESASSHQLAPNDKSNGDDSTNDNVQSAAEEEEEANADADEEQIDNADDDESTANDQTEDNKDVEEEEEEEVDEMEDEEEAHGALGESPGRLIEDEKADGQQLDSEQQEMAVIDDDNL